MQGSWLNSTAARPIMRVSRAFGMGNLSASRWQATLNHSIMPLLSFYPSQDVCEPRVQGRGARGGDGGAAGPAATLQAQPTSTGQGETTAT